MRNTGKKTTAKTNYHVKSGNLSISCIRSCFHRWFCHFEYWWKI